MVRPPTHPTCNAPSDPSTAFADPSKIPQRADIDPAAKWRLEDIYPTTEAWEADVRRVEGLLPGLAAHQATLRASGAGLLAALEAGDTIHEILDALITYAGMRRDEDHRISAHQALADRARALAVRVREAEAWMTPAILRIPAKALEGFYADTPGLALHRHRLGDLRRMRAHTLSEREERLLASVGDVARAPGEIYGAFSNADLKFGTILDEAGQEMTLTRGRFARAMESPDRRVRRDAFLAFQRAFAGFGHTLAATMGANVRTDVFYARARRYRSALEASLDASPVPVRVYENLVGTVRARIGSLHRYAELRKRWMGLDTLEAYDLYAPLVPEARMEVPYAEAKANVLAGLAPLGERYVAPLREGFEHGWIDVHETEGKSAGAYHWGPYRTHPFVLLNYSRTLNDQFILAHEMGHAMHSYFTHARQPYVYGDYVTFVAEVASTTNEALLLDHLLKRPMEPRQRRYLLNHQLEQIRTTFFRQTLFAEFEMRTHALVEAGEALTADALNGLYRELFQAYYGPALTLGPEADVEWSRVPHFYNSFYVFQYATSFAAAMAMARDLLAGDPAVVERYLTFLSSGSSDDPIPMLQRAGVDMTTPAPIEATIARFDQLLDEMERTWDPS